MSNAAAAMPSLRLEPFCGASPVGTSDLCHCEASPVGTSNYV
jgi:hypothetical protein